MALGAGVLTLAGCATGYSFVQPDVAGSGGYYTGDVPYPGQGYYDDYGTGPYYPGTSGYGYYNGTSPYSYSFGGFYGDYGYWPSFTFGLGISDVWNFPGYWGPWYSTSVPNWGCGRGCRHDRHHHHSHHDHHDPVAAVPPRPWLKPDHAPVPPRRGRDFAPRDAMPERPMERFATRRPLPSAAFAPHDPGRSPVDRGAAERFMARPVAMPHGWAGSGFTNRPTIPVAARQDFHAAPPRPISRPAPVSRSAPPPRSADGPRNRIP
jgi:hypothetical protein